MKLAKLLLAAALSLAAAAAQADTFDFSYTFDSGSVVSGSFKGTAKGNLVTGLSIISASLRSVASDGYIFTQNFGGDLSIGSALAPYPAVASFDGTQNNFKIMSRSNEVLAWHLGFESTSAISLLTEMIIFPLNTIRHFTVTLDSEATVVSRWSMTRVSAVPEPEEYALMLAGLGLIAALARRRPHRRA